MTSSNSSAEGIAAPDPRKVILRELDVPRTNTARELPRNTTARRFGAATPSSPARR